MTLPYDHQPGLLWRLSKVSRQRFLYWIYELGVLKVPESLRLHLDYWEGRLHVNCSHYHTVGILRLQNISAVPLIPAAGNAVHALRCVVSFLQGDLGETFHACKGEVLQDAHCKLQR